jgi:hypothetical protein
MADLAQWPTSPSFASVNFKINTPSIITETNSGKVRRVGMGVSYYTFTVKYPNLTPVDAGQVTGFVSQCFGPQLSFTIVLPEISYTKSTNPPSGTVTVATNAAIGVKQVSVSGAGNAKTVLKAGDFFKFSNHDKVYMCASDCVSNSGGAATLFFSGSLTTAVTTSTTLTLTAVPFTMILADDLQEFDVGIGGITTMSLDMREVY